VADTRASFQRHKANNLPVTWGTAAFPELVNICIMKRAAYIPILLAGLLLPGCAAVTAVSALPGALINVAQSQFGGEEESFLRNIESTAAAVQLSLRSMKLDADVLEIQDNGYSIGFANENIKGKIKLEKMTPKLTIMSVKVRRKMREASIERAIIESVHTKLAQVSKRQRFSLKGYSRLRAKPDSQTAKLGWYKETAELDTHRNGNSDWFRLKLPSGKTAFLQSDRLFAAALLSSQ
jgi:hypothetical protein